MKSANILLDTTTFVVVEDLIKNKDPHYYKLMDLETLLQGLILSKEVYYIDPRHPQEEVPTKIPDILTELIDEGKIKRARPTFSIFYKDVLSRLFDRMPQFLHYQYLQQEFGRQLADFQDYRRLWNRFYQAEREKGLVEYLDSLGIRGDIDYSFYVQLWRTQVYLDHEDVNEGKFVYHPHFIRRPLVEIFLESYSLPDSLVDRIMKELGLEEQEREQFYLKTFEIEVPLLTRYVLSQVGKGRPEEIIDKALEIREEQGKKMWQLIKELDTASYARIEELKEDIKDFLSEMGKMKQKLKLRSVLGALFKAPFEITGPPPKIKVELLWEEFIEKLRLYRKYRNYMFLHNIVQTKSNLQDSKTIIGRVFGKEPHL